MEFKPVKQSQDNDYASACLASILGIPLNDIPVFSELRSDGCLCDGTRFCQECNDAAQPMVAEFLASYGMGILPLTLNSAEDAAQVLMGCGYSVVVADMSIYSDECAGRFHSVVYNGGTLIHDPGSGEIVKQDNIKIHQIWLLYSLEPWKHANKQSA